MNKKVLSFIEKLEGYKTAIKQLHWDAKNMSQHELCDKIADRIADFQDQVSEVEQSITGKLKINTFKPTDYKIKDLKSFVQDVLDETNTFYKGIKDEGDTYVGMASDCESFLSDMQRNLYLVNFTMKEDFKREIKSMLSESMPKNLAKHDEVDKFMGRRPKTMKARINQIYRIVKKYGIDSKLYNDDHWQAKDDYYRAISSLGCDFSMRPCGDSSKLDDWDDITSDGGYTDYGEDGMPRSKQYAVKIMYDDGMNIGGYIKFMAAGTVEDPFKAYDTCMILWPKNNRTLKGEGMVQDSIEEYGDTPKSRGMMGAAAKRAVMRNGDTSVYQNALDSLGKRNSTKDDYNDMQRGFEMENRQIKLSEAELKQVVKEAAIQVLKETPLDYDIDNFSGRWTKSEPSDEEWALADSRANGDYLDDPFHAPNSWDDDEWVDGDKDMENDYSWGLYQRMNNVGKSPVDRQHDIMDAAQTRRDHAAYWTDKDNERGRKLMDKWIDGKRDTDELGDVDFSYDPYKYNEGKEPIKVTESELKTLVREAAMQIINEYNQRMANTNRFVKSTHGHRSGKKREATPEERAEARKRLGIKEPETVEQESIEIKPSKKGTFTAAATKHGKSVQAFAKQVLNNKEDYSPTMVKKANFANVFGKKKK